MATISLSAPSLVRLNGGRPIVERVPDHPWENRVVFNPACALVTDTNELASIISSLTSASRTGGLRGWGIAITCSRRDDKGKRRAGIYTGVGRDSRPDYTTSADLPIGKQADRSDIKVSIKPGGQSGEPTYTRDRTLKPLRNAAIDPGDRTLTVFFSPASRSK